MLNEDLIYAINTIREECKTHLRCVECPMWDTDYAECILRGSPDDWEEQGEDDDISSEMLQYEGDGTIDLPGTPKGIDEVEV